MRLVSIFFNKVPGLTLAALFAFLLLLPSVKAASLIPDSPCDALYYETLSARAWLEAQREITQNQNLILKPDSVFEYTCFDRLAYELADHADEMLSESGAYGSPFNPNTMDVALQNLVLNSLWSYHDANFGYYIGLLGGHTAATAIKHTPAATIGASSPYSCDIMRRVWQAAKCINFVSDPNTDGFYRFEEYQNDVDKRILPDACSPLGLQPQWIANIATGLTTGPWTNDPVQSYLLETAPQDCSLSAVPAQCRCSGEAIPTGVAVIRSGATAVTYDEHICIQPGCRYHPGDATIPLAGCYGR